MVMNGGREGRREGQMKERKKQRKTNIIEVPGLRLREDFRKDILTDCSLALQLGNAQIACMGFELARNEAQQLE